MDCVTCESLVRAFESKRSKYIEAVSDPHYLVSPTLASREPVDMEQAKGALGDHRSICGGYAASFWPPAPY